MKEFEGQKAILWQPGDKLSPTDYLVATCHFHGYIEAIRLYKTIRDIQLDEEFWKPLITEALNEREDSSSHSVVDDMTFCSDPSAEQHYFFIHVVQVTEAT